MKQWYFRIQQVEIEQFSEGEHFERLIFEAIKSFTANGTGEIDLSVRDISQRSTISYSTVSRFLPKLLKKFPHMIKITGKKTRVGGNVNVYKVLLLETLTVATGNALSKKSVATGEESVATGEESVAEPGIKHIQPKTYKPIYKKRKNNLSPLSYEEKLIISLEYKVDLLTVAQMEKEVLNPENILKYKYTSTFHTTRKWLGRSIQNGSIQQLGDLEYQAFVLLHGDKK